MEIKFLLIGFKLRDFIFITTILTLEMCCSRLVFKVSAATSTCEHAEEAVDARTIALTWTTTTEFAMPGQGNATIDSNDKPKARTNPNLGL